MMRKLLMLGVAMLATVSFSSCAAIFKGTSSPVTFQSSSLGNGAKVFIDGLERGETPLRLQLKTDKSYTITFRKDGKEKNYVLTNRVGTLWIVLDVLSGVLPIIIDAATGAWYEFDTDNVNVQLTPDMFHTGAL
jgi:hypothetical protein